MTTADPRYVAARKVLLHALFALAPHGKAVIVAGAQAIYLHTGANDIGIAPYTTDGDLALDSTLLGDTPELEATMRAAGFEILAQPMGQPGIWTVTLDIEGVETIVPVDLIVPDAIAPPGGRRSARIAPHGRQSARKAVGLEAAIVDHSPMTIAALDPDDGRSIIVEVAGARRHARGQGPQDQRPAQGEQDRPPERQGRSRRLSHHADRLHARPRRHSAAPSW